MGYRFGVHSNVHRKVVIKDRAGVVPTRPGIIRGLGKTIEDLMPYVICFCPSRGASDVRGGKLGGKF